MSVNKIADATLYLSQAHQMGNTCSTWTSHAHHMDITCTAQGHHMHTTWISHVHPPFKVNAVSVNAKYSKYSHFTILNKKMLYLRSLKIADNALLHTTASYFRHHLQGKTSYLLVNNVDAVLLLGMIYLASDKKPSSLN